MSKWGTICAVCLAMAFVFSVLSVICAIRAAWLYAKVERDYKHLREEIESNDKR